MKTLYVDCFSGISGDMFLSSMIDLGVPSETIISALESLKIEGLRVEFDKTIKNGISARTFKAYVFQEEADTFIGISHSHEHGHGHNHEDGHTHEHGHSHEHDFDRNFENITALINNSSLESGAKVIAKRIFTIIAEAESKIHGVDIDKIHFHEVGAYDSIADIIGAAVAIDWLKPERIIFSPLPMTRGFVKCNHGIIPLPAPATAEILSGIPVTWEKYDFEMVTPTGAAIAVALAEAFASPPSGKILATGYGAGKKTYERPNVVRTMLINSDDITDNISDNNTEDVFEIQTNIDDMSSELIGDFMTGIFSEGALDAWAEPIFMKKSRPAYKISILSKETDFDRILNKIFENTSTFGVRYSKKNRRILDRKYEEIKFRDSVIRIKIGSLNGNIIKGIPEFEDCKKAAEKYGISVTNAYNAALCEYLKKS